MSSSRYRSDLRRKEATMAQIEFSAFAMELKRFLVDINDERQHDVEFINGRSEAAAVAFEDARHQGHTVDQAMEIAHSVLMEGFTEES